MVRTIPDKSITITVTARPLSKLRVTVLPKSRLTQRVHKGIEDSRLGLNSELQTFYNDLLATFRTNSDQVHYKAHDWDNDLNRTWAFGPNFSGGNILLNLVDDWDDFQSPYFSVDNKTIDESYNDGNVYKSSKIFSLASSRQRKLAHV